MLDYYKEVNRISESQWYEGVRTVLPTPLRDLGEQELDTVLSEILAHLPEEEQKVMIESIGSITKNIGRTLANNAGQIGTIGGAAIGTYVGGPAGTAIGSQIGGALGNRIGSAVNGRNQQTSPSPAREPQPINQRTTPGGTVGSRANTVGFNTPDSPLNVARTELNALKIINDAQFLIQVVQAVIESILKVMLNNQGQRRNTSQDNLIPLESFANALQVYSEELAIKYSKGQTNGHKWMSPKRRADLFMTENFK